MLRAKNIGLRLAYEQWGYAQKPTSEYDFDWVYPIPFPTLVGAIMLTPQYEGQCRMHSINSFDRFSCSFRTDGTRTDLNSNHVFAIGFQQWGYNTQSEDYNVKVTLPIAYAIKHYIVVSNAEDKYAGGVYVTGSYKLTLTNFMLSKTESTQPVFWISLGIQQWGRSLTTNANANVTFPITFERIVYFVDVFSLEAGRPCLFTKSHPITTDGFYWEYNYHGDDVGVQWLAIGV